MVYQHQRRLNKFRDAHVSAGKTKQNINLTKERIDKMKAKLMKRALKSLVTAARVRWLQTNVQLHNIREKHGNSKTVLLANIAEGTHDGNITKAVDAVITERFLLAKIGSASDRVAVAGAA